MVMVENVLNNDKIKIFKLIIFYYRYIHISNYISLCIYLTYQDYILIYITYINYIINLIL